MKRVTRFKVPLTTSTPPITPDETDASGWFASDGVEAARGVYGFRVPYSAQETFGGAQGTLGAAVTFVSEVAPGFLEPHLPAGERTAI